MRTTERRRASLALILLWTVVTLAGCETAAQTDTWKPDIPRTWDPEALHAFEVPLANPDYSPAHVTPDYYYQLPERPIYKSYPVYAPGHEPEGDMDWVATQPPEVVFDPSTF